MSPSTPVGRVGGYTRYAADNPTRLSDMGKGCRQVTLSQFKRVDEQTRRTIIADPYRMFVRPEGDEGERGAELMERHGGPMTRRAIEELRLRPSDTVLEIGFGPGLALQHLAGIVVGGHVAGVDPSPLMHRRASARNAGAIAEGRLVLFEARVETLPIEDESFDAALAIDNLHFWGSPLVGLREIHRVLRCGSLFLCAFTPPSGGRIAGLPDLLIRAGFEDARTFKSDAGSLATARKPPISARV